MIIPVMHYKGGAGKTVTAFNLAGAAAQDGRRVLLVDLDPQATLTEFFEGADPERTIYHACTRACALGEAAVPVREGEGGGRLDFVPGHEHMSVVQAALRTRQLGTHLRELLRGEGDGGGPADAYDYVFLDCPPGVDFLGDNAIRAADAVLSSMATQFASRKGLNRLRDNLAYAAGEGHRPRWLILPTLFRSNESESRLMYDLLVDAHGRFPEGRILEPVPRLAAVSVSPQLKRTIFEHQAASPGAEAYWSAYGALERLRTGGEGPGAVDEPTAYDRRSRPSPAPAPPSEDLL